MSRLFIIGNGFDLSHGLNTSFDDFKDYLKKTDTIYYDKITDLYINHDDNLWSSFEETLGNLDFEEDLLDLLSWTLGDPLSDDWRDSMNNDFNYEIDERLEVLCDLTSKFEEWLNKIKIDLCTCQYKFNDDDNFLTFNYTLILEIKYHIDAFKILHIHGSVFQNSKIIIGHSNDCTIKLDENSYIYDDYRIQKGVEAYNEKLEIIYKPITEIIKNNETFLKKKNEEIFVLGHSLSEVDMEYFKFISNNNKEAKWIISYYSNSDFENCKNMVENLGIKNSKIVKYEDIINLM